MYDTPCDLLPQAVPRQASASAVRAYYRLTTVLWFVCPLLWAVASMLRHLNTCQPLTWAIILLCNTVMAMATSSNSSTLLTQRVIVHQQHMCRHKETCPAASHTTSHITQHPKLSRKCCCHFFWAAVQQGLHSAEARQASKLSKYPAACRTLPQQVCIC